MSIFIFLCLCVGLSYAGFSHIPGTYCAARPGGKCCPGRDDQCTMPVMGTLCYCDMFCARTNGADCCPDFRFHCLGEPRPELLVAPCTVNGKPVMIGRKIKVNCNTCTCTETRPGHTELVCDDQPCLIRNNIIDAVNEAFFGWTASNYSFFWGETLEEGIQRHLGTKKPEQIVLSMNEVNMNGQNPTSEEFDARRQWPGLIQPIRDQGNCGSSWAVSTADVAADRLAVLTKGADRIALSVQQLLDCQDNGRQGCGGGYPDRAWRFLAEEGVVPEACYPYKSGKSGKTGFCEVKKGTAFTRSCPGGSMGATTYKTPPPYRVGSDESHIRAEIQKNGPVQAVLVVHEDFYMYKSGVYRYTNPIPHEPEFHRKSALHSVRIIGWGVDRTQRRPVKYWLCANSWGREWGEDGYFRILRGEDESAIEMFVVGVWAKKSNGDFNHLRN